MKLRLSFLALAAAAIGLPSVAVANTFSSSLTDQFGAVYSFSMGADLDGATPGETRNFTLEVDTSGITKAKTDWLDAVGIKASGSVDSVTGAGAPGSWNSGLGVIDSKGCKSGTADFMMFCANPNGVNPIGGTYTFTWQAHATGTFFDGVNSLISLKAVYDAGAKGSEGFYQVSTTLPVPEPETYAMMLAGLAALGFMVRRRRQA